MPSVLRHCWLGVYISGTGLPRLPWKRGPLNGWSSSSFTKLTFPILATVYHFQRCPTVHVQTQSCLHAWQGIITQTDCYQHTAARKARNRCNVQRIISSGATTAPLSAREATDTVYWQYQNRGFNKTSRATYNYDIVLLLNIRHIPLAINTALQDNNIWYSNTRVVSVLASGAKGPGSNHSRDTVA